ncbi:FUSC family protein [Streptococcus merionis]|uniref:FUSC family protein n=1 Tax=Streptococcus merionis TaxID=400065 RepID=UPI0035156344
MKLKIDWQQMRPGMRVVKSGLAVFFTLLLFKLFDWEGVQIAALSAVFSLREDFDSSVHFGASRIYGNAVGGLYAFLFFLIETAIGQHFWLTLFVVPLFAMLTISTNVAMDNKPGVIGGVSAFLIITLSIPSGNRLMYALIRVAETFIGVFIAIIINSEWKKVHQSLFQKKIKK